MFGLPLSPFSGPVSGPGLTAPLDSKISAIQKTTVQPLIAKTLGRSRSSDLVVPTSVSSPTVSVKSGGAAVEPFSIMAGISSFFGGASKITDALSPAPSAAESGAQSGDAFSSASGDIIVRGSKGTAANSILLISLGLLAGGLVFSIFKGKKKK